MNLTKALDYDVLKTLHHLLQLRADLVDQLHRCPRAIKVAENATANFSKAADEAKTQWQNCKKEADAKQMTMNQREARIEQLKSRRNACDSNKEFQLLNDQIAADEQANSVLADEILEMLERADVLNQGIVQARSELAQAEKELSRVKNDMTSKQQKLEGDIATVDLRLKEAERGLNGEFLVEFRRRVIASGHEALAETHGESCGNCHQVITTQTLSLLYQKREVYCQGCQAIMYLIRN